MATKKTSTQVQFNRFSIQGKTPMELAYMRRLCVREQKRHLITRKLEENLPVGYLIMHCVVLALWTICVICIQIVLIVFKSSLYFICPGFWVGAFFILCIILVVFLVLKRSYGFLMGSWICHGIGILACLGGIVIVNAMDLAFYNTSCIDACTVRSYQYLNLIMIVLGILGILVCGLYVLIMECSIFKESRALNVYLNNPN